jgi:hypothetical protein
MGLDTGPEIYRKYGTQPLFWIKPKRIKGEKYDVT